MGKFRDRILISRARCFPPVPPPPRADQGAHRFISRADNFSLAFMLL
jgi:hypothetical protein